MNPKIQLGLKGHFTLIVSGPRGVRIYEAPNLLLGAGIDRAMSSSSALHGFVQIGTGNAPPDISDAALQNRVASTSTIQSTFSNTYVAGPPDYVETTITYRFALGALDSSASGNFAEVGIGWLSIGGLASRALITDGGGTPTAISVLLDEQLDVVYRLRVYPIQSDVTGSITLKGASYNYIIRPAGLSEANAAGGRWGAGACFLAGGAFTLQTTPAAAGVFDARAYTGGIAPRTTIPTGNLTTTNTTIGEAIGSYTNGSYQRLRRTTWNLNDANGSAKTLLFQCGGTFPAASFTHQIEFTPALPKINTDRLTLDMTYSLANRP